MKKVGSWLADPPMMVKTVLIIWTWEITKAVAHAL